MTGYVVNAMRNAPAVDARLVVRGSQTWAWRVTMADGRAVTVALPQAVLATLARRALSNKSGSATQGGMTAKAAKVKA